MQSKKQILKVNNNTILDYNGYYGKEAGKWVSGYTKGRNYLTPTIYVMGNMFNNKPLITIGDKSYTPDDIAKEVALHCVKGDNDIILLLDYAAENGFSTEFATALNNYLKNKSDISSDTRASTILACKDRTYVIDDIRSYFSTFGLQNYAKVSLPKNEKACEVKVSKNMFSNFYHIPESDIQSLTPLQATLSTGFIGFEK